jgi:hypothetical protein
MARSKPLLNVAAAKIATAAHQLRGLHERAIIKPSPDRSRADAEMAGDAGQGQKLW